MQVDKCGVCGKLSAVLQTCRLCKRRVCEEHFNQEEGVCSQCYSRLGLAAQTKQETSMSATLLKLFFLGFFLMFIGVVMLAVAAWFGGGEASFSGGAIIIIGFIPIVVGAGPYAFFAVLIAAVLTIIAFALFVWMRKHVSEA